MRSLPEHVVRDRLARRLAPSDTEVALDGGGIADIMTDDLIVEVKHATSVTVVAQAMGQVVLYGHRARGDYSLRVHAFGTKAELDKAIDEHVKDMFKSNGVDLTTEVITTSEIEDWHAASAARLASAPHRLQMLDPRLGHGIARTLADASGREITAVRESDGYFWTGTLVTLKPGNKSFGDWSAQTKSIRYIDALSRHTGVQQTDLCILGTSPFDSNVRGYWTHRQVLVEIAGWVSPDFRVVVADIVMRYFSGQITTEESRQVASALSPSGVINTLNDERAALERQVASATMQACTDRSLAAEAFERERVAEERERAAIERERAATERERAVVSRVRRALDVIAHARDLLIDKAGKGIYGAVYAAREMLFTDLDHKIEPADIDAGCRYQVPRDYVP